MWFRKVWVSVAAVAIAFPSLAQQIYEVDTTVDTTLGNCTAAPNDCGLRGAITRANTDGADSEIILADGIHQLAFVGPNDDNNLAGDLDVKAAVEIKAAPGSVPIIEQTVIGRVFHIHMGSGRVRIAGPMIIAGGQATGSSALGGGIFADRSGDLELEDVVLSGNLAADAGGCLNYMGAAGFSLSLNRVTLSDCHTATRGGGARISGGQTTITSSLIESSTAYDSGGGIRYDGSSIVILDTTILGNLAGNQFTTHSQGGGLDLSGGSVVLRQSTVSDNQAGVPTTTSSIGGGVFVAQTTSLLIENSTISGNRTEGTNQFGAGINIENGFNSTLDHTSVVDNSTQGEEGLYFFDTGGQGLTLKNSIIDDGCSGFPNSIISAGFNVERPWDGSTNSTCNLTNPSDLQVTDLMVKPLAGYGGPTTTHALQPGSPAQLHVSSAQCQAEDQRHATRQGLFCDAGAYDDSSIPPGQWIFADGFESGNPSAWSTAAP